MEDYVYLIKNGDLYILGSTKNLEKTQDLLNPGKLYAYLKTNNADSMCKKLQNRYFNERLPNSDYFRLKRSQLLECQLILKNQGGEKFFEPIFKGRTMVLTFLISWVSISLVIIKLGLDPLFKNLF